MHKLFSVFIIKSHHSIIVYMYSDKYFGTLLKYMIITIRGALIHIYIELGPYKSVLNIEVSTEVS